MQEGDSVGAGDGQNAEEAVAGTSSEVRLQLFRVLEELGWIKLLLSSSANSN